MVGNCFSDYSIIIEQKATWELKFSPDENVMIVFVSAASFDDRGSAVEKLIVARKAFSCFRIVCCSSSSSSSYEMKWKLCREKFINSETMIKRNTETAHTFTPPPCNSCQKKIYAKKREAAKPKAAKNTKKSRKEENHFSWNFILKRTEIFCFIYSPSVDEVGSVFSCAPNGLWIQQTGKKRARLISDGEIFVLLVLPSLQKKSWKGREKIIEERNSGLVESNREKSLKWQKNDSQRIFY